MSHPYSDLPERAYWRAAVGGRHYADLKDLAEPIPVPEGAQIATAGSCFAQHIGRHLRLRGQGYLDMEPAPDFLTEAEARQNGYGLFTCRYGNVYTARQLLQLTQEAMGLRQPLDIVWPLGQRHVDALRPSVDPVGHAQAADVLALRAMHLRAVLDMLKTLDVMVFTLGLTEAWRDRRDGTVYPTAPGTVAGVYDPQIHEFVNFSYADVLADLTEFRKLLHSINPRGQMILTVSPVPLAATASGGHVLVATGQSKATLRAVAGDLARSHEDIFYFPSYEIISSHPARGMFFEPDLRNVNDFGVSLVMQHFFGALGAQPGVVNDTSAPDTPICDESRLDVSAL
ncbi:GSCFA domain-containing protein [Rhodobacter sp. 24-YEA-8]|uniref:GSCFA domain-containing protein n=1 Tax=Rhodobacter sp. 24-YEA-8 TaxID=1884310 RepID=UPI00089D9291|nr:GSCFA domain-containing protein [Rhodobacter sp. 24-YEA-8]SEB40933.1 GSCFA family protein [Rhodobacter sp. 24-YEA-8]